MASDTGEAMSDERSTMMPLSEIDLAQNIAVSLTRAEIVVLGSCLEPLIDESFARKTIDEAERQALWALTNVIEQICNDSFRPDYQEILALSKAQMGDFSK